MRGQRKSTRRVWRFEVKMHLMNFVKDVMKALAGAVDAER